MSYTSNYNLNIRLSALEARINALVPPPPGYTYDLLSVLGIGNNAGTFDIDMNNNDILNCNDLDVVTINGGAYPPVVPADDLQATLTAGNTADLGFNLSDTVGTDTSSIVAGLVPSTASLTCGHVSSSFTTSTEINAQSGAVEYLGSVADTGTSLTTKRFLLSNGSVFNRDRATDGAGITVTSDELTDYTLNVSSTKAFDNGTILNTLTQTVNPVVVSQANLFKTTGVDESNSAMNASSGNANFACSYQTDVADISNVGSIEVTTGSATCSVQAVSILSGQSQLLRMETGLVGDALLEHLVPSGTNNLKIQSTNKLLLQSASLNATATNLSMTSAGVGGQANPLLTLTNNNATGSVAMEVYKQKPTAGVAGDVLFNQSVYGKDSANTKQEYTRISHTLRDSASGLEDGSIEFSAFVNGSVNTFLQINGNENEINCLKTLDMGGNNIRTSTGDLSILTTGASGSGDISLTAKRTINLTSGSSNSSDVNITADGGDVNIISNGSGKSIDLTSASNVDITTGDNLTLTAGAILQLDSTDLRLANATTVVATPNFQGYLAMTGFAGDITNYLRLKVNGSDIWLPYWTSDPSI
jgi:hypothetical protein